MLIFDSHLDVAWNGIEWNRDLNNSIEEIRRAESGMSGVARGTNTVSFPELRKAEVGLFIGTILARRIVAQHPPFVPFETPEAAYQASIRQQQYYRTQIQRGTLRMIEDLEGLESHLQSWNLDPAGSPLGFILSMEGADPVIDVENLEEWWKLGLRILGLAHYGQNRYTHGTGTTGDLKPDGLLLLKEMERLGMFLDVTHLTDEAFDTALDRFSGPVLASHHNCRSLVPGQRQIEDRQIMDLIGRDAVIGIAFDAWMLEPGWVLGKSDPSKVVIEKAVDHIDHICQLAGDCSHVGIGSDLDGGFGIEQTPSDLDTIADLQKLPHLLDKRGYREEDIQSILHMNWINFFRRSWA